jgi:hypothetical protein
MGSPWVARLCLGTALAGCAAGAPVPTLERLTPATAYTDRPLRVTIHGEGFIPSYRLDPVHDARRGDARGFSGRMVGPMMGLPAVALRDFDWLDTGQLTAWMDPGLTEGTYALELRDPRGQSVTLASAFRALGPDRSPPLVDFPSPPRGTPVAPGTMVKVTVLASDPSPGALSELSWDTGDPDAPHPCALLPSPAEVRCDFEVPIPSAMASGEHFAIGATALDQAPDPNRTRRVLTFVLNARPTLDAVEPASGGSAGGTDVVVTGSGFLAGARVLVDGQPLLPEGGMLVDDQTISGRMPPHPPGPASVTLVSPVGEGKPPLTFFYGEPPAINVVVPSEGLPAGGTAVKVFGERFGERTQVLFGETLAEAQPLMAPQLVSDREIDGTAPAGRGRTSVWVFDTAFGWDRLPGGFGWGGP